MNQNQIRKIVEEFVEIFYHQKNVRKAFMEYVAEDYIQHNPNIPDGRAAAIEFLEPKFSNPSAIFDVKRILVDGNLAMVHLHGRMSADSLGGAVADIFRLEVNTSKVWKIVEHWGVLQAVPESCVNPHPMF